MTIAIDFGTSNTVVARWNDATQSPETLALPGLSLSLSGHPPLVPSLAYVEQPQATSVQVGQEVRDRGLDLITDPRFFRNFKRGIGTPLQGFLPEVGGQTLTFEQVGQWFLERLLLATTTLVGPVESLILTVPVDSFETYRQWLADFTTRLDIPQVRMIDEPTAAALGYGLTGKPTILVLDFGGGTLDWSLVRLSTAPEQAPLGFILKWGRKASTDLSQKPQPAKVLAKAGENLGGADIDNWLVDHFHQTQGLPITPITLRLAERLKIKLSSQLQASEAFFNDETLETYELHLDRAGFEAILEANQFFQRLENGLTQIRQQARRQGLEPEQIDAVLLVGGTAQIPAVQEWIQKHFNPDQIYSDAPFEAVAHGALQLQQGLEVEDFLYHGYGIRYWDRRHNRHSWHPIINPGQPYPMAQPVELTLGASVDQQPSIELIVGELGEAPNRTEVYFEAGRLVTRQIGDGSQQVQPLNDRDGARSIAQLNPPGVPGTDRIRVEFVVDRDRMLRITVEDILTGDTLLANQPVVELR